MSRKKPKPLKPLSPKQFHSKAKKYIGKRQPLKGKKAASAVKHRTTSYTKGTKLMQDVTNTLRQVAARHPDPKVRKKAKDAIKKLDDARAQFGSACLCMEVPFEGSGS